MLAVWLGRYPNFIGLSWSVLVLLTRRKTQLEIRSPFAALPHSHRSWRVPCARCFAGNRLVGLWLSSGSRPLSGAIFARRLAVLFRLF